jgi:hypothetical protein
VSGNADDLLAEVAACLRPTMRFRCLVESVDAGHDGLDLAGLDMSGESSRTGASSLPPKVRIRPEP